ncbi:TPA: DNA gyrase subunit A, partial [Patescibacteria group bacterium]|nr:DNA gyrase subunit A [Patescibacteria group bacterium]
TIRKSKTQDSAKTNLIDKFKFTEVQAQAILDMQLRRLAALEKMKLRNEHKDIKKKIKEYNLVLESEGKILEVIDADLQIIKENFGDERKSKVIKGKIGEINEEDMVASENTLVTITHSGYIKRVDPDSYRSQRRGGKGVSGGNNKKGDFVEHAILCNTLDELMLFSNKGKVYTLRVFEIPEYNRTAKGLPLVNLIQLDQNDLITSFVTRDSKGGVSEGKDNDDKGRNKYLTMVTRNGVIKKTKISDFNNIRANGLIALTLEESDELTWVKPTTGNDEVILITSDGKSIRFKESDVRAMGRTAKGVTAMKFKSKTDHIVGMGIIKSEQFRLLTISERGYAKMTELKEYGTQKRAGSGIFTFKVTTKTGSVIAAKILDNPKDTEVVVISEKSKVIRSSLKAVPTQGRQTSGVKIMNVDANDKVATVAMV